MPITSAVMFIAVFHHDERRSEGAPSSSGSGRKLAEPTIEPLIVTRMSPLLRLMEESPLRREVARERDMETRAVERGGSDSGDGEMPRAARGTRTSQRFP